jgi:hypothetical protein
MNPITATDRVKYLLERIEQEISSVRAHQGRLEDARSAMYALAALRERAVELMASPRDNWESERQVIGGLYVLLTTGVNPQTSQQVAICQLRKHNSSELDQYQFQAPITSAKQLREAWIDTLERAICAIDGLIGQQLGNFGLPQHPPAPATSR